MLSAKSLDAVHRPTQAPRGEEVLRVQDASDLAVTERCGQPGDDAAKALLKDLFGLKTDPRIAGGVAFLEDHDMGKASLLTAGCDVWLNLPRPPLEASGTSGIKAAFNGT